MPARQQVETWELVTIPRRIFASEYFWYEPGEAVCIAGPMQRGKTRLAFDLLEFCATAQCPAFVIVSKPRDPVTREQATRLHYRFCEDWPVPIKVSQIWEGKPSGYVIWPPFGDLNKDIDRAAGVARRVLEDRYAQGVRMKQGIVIVDDTRVKEQILGLKREMTTYLAMAGAMDVALWTFIQKPTGSGDTAIWSYGAAEHVFIFRDPDKRNRQRYDEIGGVDAKQVEALTYQLQPFQALYLKRTLQDGKQVMCIVDKD